MVQRAPRTSSPTGSRCSSSGRQASYYDPKTKQFTLIDTCYSTHHLQFDNDANETVYFNELIGPIVRLDRHEGVRPDEGRAEGRSAGAARWSTRTATARSRGRGTCCRSRGDSVALPGRHDARRRRAEADAARQRALRPEARHDGQLQPVRGDSEPRRRLGLGRQRALPRLPRPAAARQQSAVDPARRRSSRCPSPASIRAASTSTANGVVWTALAASSHLASFDVRKCKDLNGPAKIDGSQCTRRLDALSDDRPEAEGHATFRPTSTITTGWISTTSRASAPNTPFATGSNSDALLALNPQTDEWTTLRVPYPLGFYSRGMDGRIDDPNAGWKGRAL